MKLCNKPMPKAENGVDRGFCTRLHGHARRHGNGTCNHCGEVLSLQNANTYVTRQGSGYCRVCRRTLAGQRAFNHQQLGKMHTFFCGCTGILPEKWNQANQFVTKGTGPGGSKFKCRVSRILRGSVNSAKAGGYKYIPIDTPHSVIRTMMANPNCWLCGERLQWTVILGCRAPHLHHNHETGEPLGFTHPVCNPRAMEKEISRLKQLLKEK